MRVVRISVLVSFVLVAAATSAAAPQDSIVRANGQIGPFRIDVTTEAKVRAVNGKPTRVENQFFPSKKTPVGRTLYYRCGTSCLSAFSFNNATGRLSDFWTRSPRFRTERGSFAGMLASRAAALERREIVPGCGDGLYIHIRWDAQHAYVLTITRGRVTGITYQGPYSVYYDGLC